MVKENTGYLQVDDKMNAIQNLSTDKLVMREAGFIEIFVNNESQTPVYYDDFMVTHSGGSGPVMEVNAYYPFGMLIPGLSISAWPDKKNYYKWSTKEIQEELGLNWYDHGARMYDPEVGRWWVPDPLAEKYYSWSPYNYTLNNPIKNIDPDGRIVGTIVGTIVGGAVGAYDAYKKGTDVWAGAAEGAVSGAITGAAVDITIATGGTGLVLVGACVAAGTVGGAVGAVAGDATGQVVTDMRKDATFSEAVSNIKTDNMVDKAIGGAATGAVGGLTGGAVGAVGKAAAASTKTVQSTMSKNITETAKTLTNMGADTKTVGTAVNKITTGMGEAGKNTVTTTNGVSAGAGMATETSIKMPQIEELNKLKK